MAEKENKTDSLGFENFEDDTPKINEAEAQYEAISFSVKLVSLLSAKMKGHNSLAKENKVSLSELKKVYINAGNCDRAKEAKISCGEWALARVNMFLRQKSGGKMISSSSKTEAGRIIDISETWVPAEEDYEKAQKEIKEHNLGYDFESTGQLYIEPYEKLEIEW